MSNTLNGTARQFVFRNLEEFSTYQFSVVAVNSAGQSAESTLVADTRSAGGSVISRTYMHSVTNEER